LPVVFSDPVDPPFLRLTGEGAFRNTAGTIVLSWDHGPMIDQQATALY
jgi:hypothetical protein